MRLQKKMEHGKQLSEEEKNFMKEERVRKTFSKNNEEEKEDERNKGKKKNEKVDKNKKKGKDEKNRLREGGIVAHRPALHAHFQKEGLENGGGGQGRREAVQPVAEPEQKEIGGMFHRGLPCRR